MIEAIKALWELVARFGWLKIIIANLFALVPITFVLSLFGVLIANADTLHAKMVAMTAAVGTASWAGMYAKINTCVPLTESLSLLGLLMTLKVYCMLFRWVKSMIPTIN